MRVCDWRSSVNTGNLLHVLKANLKYLLTKPSGRSGTALTYSVEAIGMSFSDAVKLLGRMQGLEDWNETL